MKRNKKKNISANAFAVLFFLFSVTLFSSLQAQITVTPTSFCQGVDPAPNVAISIRITTGLSPYTVRYRIGPLTSPIITRTSYISTTPIAVPLPIATTQYTIASITDRTGATVPVSGNVTVTVINRPGVPQITANGPTTFCQGESVVLTSSSGTTYKWTTPQGTILTTQSIVASTPGEYKVQVTNANGCLSVTSVPKNITIAPLSAPVIENITPPNCLIATGSVTLSGLPATGTWTINPGAITGTGTTTTLSGLNTGNYQFTVTNQSGCISSPTPTISMEMETAPTEVPVLNPEINGCKASFTQTWNAVPSATGYRLDVSTDPDFVNFLSGYQDKELSNVTSETITGIIPGSTYYVRLKAINSCGASPYSNSITVSPVTTTYENGVWSNGFPDSTKSIVFNSDFNIDANMNGCSCQVNAGANVIVQSAITLKLENALSVAPTGSLTFENSASLVQINNISNTGSINYKRTALQIRQADYVYWSTPVTPQKLINVSPLTAGDKFYGHVGSGWVYTDRNSNMVVGKGYIIRGPDSYSNTAKKDYTATFKGTPNNGDIYGESLTADKFVLIGNPYPSALSADALLAANPLLEGTFYFWTHNTPVVLSGAYQYNADDYTTYNLTGGVATSLSAPSDPNHSNNPANDRGNRPTGQIGAGQSFFIATNAGGKVFFNNAMRSGGTDNTQFYKQSNTARTAGIEKHRIWLNLTNKGGAFKQLLVGYIQGATNAFDSRYDGASLNGNKYIDFYSIADGENFTIQGRALPFADTDIVPLGYKTTIAGEFTIAIDEVDGLFKNQAIYLEDKQTNTFVDLRCKNYTFSTVVGTFANRFVIHYNNTENRQFVQSPIATSHTLSDCGQTSYIQEWTAAPDAIGYKLDVATDSNFTNFLAGYQSKELGNVTSDTINGITPGTTYYVRLRTFNGCGESLNSNVVTIDPISTTYENGVWSNGLPDGSKTAVFNSNYSIATDLNACSCKVNAGIIVTAESGVTVKLENGLNVAETGTLIFENNASLVQVNETPNSGKIIYKRTSSPMKIFDYNYWSSPVMEQKLNTLSPNTSSDKYFSFDDNKWVNENGNNPMIPAKGYTIQAPKPGRGSNGEFVSFPYSQPVQFIGVPNNGHQEFVSDGSGLLNLIGNPYPSSIDADLFLEANSDVLAGTIYLWTRNNSYLQNIFNPDDYAVYNALGGISVASSSSDSETSNSYKPTGKIAAGQSFFVESLTTGTVAFNNSMRLSGQNTQFFKQAQDSTITGEKHRFWLNLTNKLGVFKQILVGYMTGATNDSDNRFDSKTWDRNPYVNFYSINSDANLSIQGRALPFDNTDVVALGYRATIGGSFSIAIDQVDGLFTTQDIYLEDKVKNEYHNLKEGPYTFSTFSGTFNNRFVVHYSIPTSTSNSFSTNKIVVSVGDNQIQVKSSKQKIQKVMVYDFNGRIIFEKNNIDNTNFLTDKLFIKRQILIVKTTLEDGKADSYKVIF